MQPLIVFNKHIGNSFISSRNGCKIFTSCHTSNVFELIYRVSQCSIVVKKSDTSFTVKAVYYAETLTTTASELKFKVVKNSDTTPLYVTISGIFKDLHMVVQMFEIKIVTFVAA